MKVIQQNNLSLGFLLQTGQKFRISPQVRHFLFGGLQYLTIIPRARIRALIQWPMRPKDEWAIDSEDMRARGIIV